MEPADVFCFAGQVYKRPPAARVSDERAAPWRPHELWPMATVLAGASLVVLVDAYRRSLFPFQQRRAKDGHGVHLAPSGDRVVRLASLALAAALSHLRSTLRDIAQSVQQQAVPVALDTAAQVNDARLELVRQVDTTGALDGMLLQALAASRALSGGAKDALALLSPDVVDAIAVRVAMTLPISPPPVLLACELCGAMGKCAPLSPARRMAVVKALAEPRGVAWLRLLALACLSPPSDELDSLASSAPPAGFHDVQAGAQLRPMLDERWSEPFVVPVGVKAAVREVHADLAIASQARCAVVVFSGSNGSPARVFGLSPRPCADHDVVLDVSNAASSSTPAASFVYFRTRVPYAARRAVLATLRTGVAPVNPHAAGLALMRNFDDYPTCFAVSTMASMAVEAAAAASVVQGPVVPLVRARHVCAFVLGRDRSACPCKHVM